MPIPYADGTITQSEIRLQDFSDVPLLVLKHSAVQDFIIEIELTGKTVVDARSLIHACLTFCPTAINHTIQIKR